MLAGSPFIGEGYRKAWARLRLAGVRTSQGRVLRLMQEAGLLAPTRVGRRRGPRNHDGTITTGHPDEMWGTDATAASAASGSSVARSMVGLGSSSARPPYSPRRCSRSGSHAATTSAIR